MVTSGFERRTRGIHLGWVAFGWFVAAAVTATILFVLITVGIVDRSASEGSTGTLIAVAVGFFAGGFTTARRSTDRPLAHGLAIGGFTLTAWLVSNLVARAVTGTRTWAALPLAETLAVLAIQALAAALGSWVSHARGRTG